MESLDEKLRALGLPTEGLSQAEKVSRLVEAKRANRKEETAGSSGRGTVGTMLPQAREEECTVVALTEAQQQTIEASNAPHALYTSLFQCILCGPNARKPCLAKTAPNVRP